MVWLSRSTGLNFILQWASEETRGCHKSLCLAEPSAAPLNDLGGGASECSHIDMSPDPSLCTAHVRVHTSQTHTSHTEAHRVAIQTCRHTRTHAHTAHSLPHTHPQVHAPGRTFMPWKCKRTGTCEESCGRRRAAGARTADQLHTFGQKIPFLYLSFLVLYLFCVHFSRTKSLLRGRACGAW